MLNTSELVELAGPTRSRSTTPAAWPTSRAFPRAFSRLERRLGAGAQGPAAAARLGARGRRSAGGGRRRHARLGTRPRGAAVVLGSAQGAAVGTGPVLLAECRRPQGHEPAGRRRRDPRGRAVHLWRIDSSLWVAPARNGGFCSLWLPAGGGGCGALGTSAQHRSLAPAGQAGVGHQRHDRSRRRRRGHQVQRREHRPPEDRLGFCSIDAELLRLRRSGRRADEPGPRDGDRRVRPEGRLLAAQTFTDGPAG